MGCAQLSCRSRRPATCSGAARRADLRIVSSVFASAIALLLSSCGQQTVGPPAAPTSILNSSLPPWSGAT